MPDWKKITITLEDRPVRMPNGEIAPMTEQPIVGSTIDHWAAIDLAYSWIRQAKAYLDDRALLAQCDAPPNFSDRAANELQAQKQQNFVWRVANAYAQYCNALNIVAMNDPFVRRAYHKWISGPPAGDNTADQMRHWFSPSLNFGGGSGDLRQYGRWFFPNETYPIFGSSRAKPPAGLISNLARNAFERFYPDAATHPSLFVINVGIHLRRDPAGEPTPAAVEYQNYTRNVAETERRKTPEGLGVNVGNLGIGFMPDGTKLPALFGNSTFFWDWRAVFFDVDPVVGPVGNDVNLGLVAPMRAYLDFLNEIVTGALNRTARQVIQDTRVYVAWMNARQIITGYQGNASAFLQGVSGRDTDVLTAQLAGDPGIAAASRVVGGVGPAVGAAIGAVNPIAGGIVALVSGALGGVLALINRAIQGPVYGKGKDDIGRWKPVLQRGVLSGDVTDVLGQPLVSDLVPPPIGLLPTPAGPIATPVTSSYDDFDWGQFKPKPKKEDSGILPWALGALLVIGGAIMATSKPGGRKRAART